MKSLRSAISLVLAPVLIIVAFAGCSGAGSYDKAAKKFLSRVLPCSLERAAQLEEILEEDLQNASPDAAVSGTERTEAYLKEKFSDVMTQKCITQAAANRALFGCKTRAEEYETDIKADNIELYGDISNDLLFYYSAELFADGEKVAIADGSVLLSDDGNNKADSFSIKIREE